MIAKPLRAWASISLAATLVAMFVLAPTLALAYATLVVQVRTDMKPGVDFAKIRTQLLSGRMGTLIQERTKRAHSGQDWARGIRVAEISRLGEGKYRLLVSALDRKGKVVVERPARLELKNGVRVITVLLSPEPKPAVDKCKAQFTREKRACGLALKKCIDDRTSLASCQNTHKTCMKEATIRRGKCSMADDAGRLNSPRNLPFANPR